VEVVQVGVEGDRRAVGSTRTPRDALDAVAHPVVKGDDRHALDDRIGVVGRDERDVVARGPQRDALLVQDAMVVDGMDGRDVADAPHICAAPSACPDARLLARERRRP
jgi:hypothetical protein